MWERRWNTNRATTTTTSYRLHVVSCVVHRRHRRHQRQRQHHQKERGVHRRDARRVPATPSPSPPFPTSSSLLLSSPRVTSREWSRGSIPNPERPPRPHPLRFPNDTDRIENIRPFSLDDLRQPPDIRMYPAGTTRREGAEGRNSSPDAAPYRCSRCSAISRRDEVTRGKME